LQETIMAVWKFSLVNNMPQYFPLLMQDIADLTTMTLTGNNSGFRFSEPGLSAGFGAKNLTIMSVSGQPPVITGGQVTSATIRVDGQLALQGTGLSVSAAKIFQAIDGHDEDMLMRRLFEDADDITGTSKTDYLFGYAGADTIKGGVGDDNIYGGGGNDRLLGGGGRDMIDGGPGNDVIIAGAGQDSIYAGDGADRIVFDAAPVDGQRDYIQNFTSGSDRIQLDQDIFTAIGPVGLLASGRFRLGTAAGDANDRIIYDNLSGTLYYDRDGNGAAAAQIIAEMVDAPALTAADFQIIA
jgi:Ca2+-binding RTX toxin-like protein